MRYFKYGPIGIIGLLVLAAELVSEIITPALKWPWLRRLLEMANLGQVVDFVVEHWEHPGWLGDPSVQISVIIMGLALIFWDKRRPSWLPSPEVSPRQMIVGGFAIILIGVMVLGVGLWRQPNNLLQPITHPTQSPAQQPATIAPKPTYSSFEREKLKGLMIQISELINTDGAQILAICRKYFPYGLGGLAQNLNAKEQLDILKDLQERTERLYMQIYKKILPENKYFSRDLYYIVGGEDLKNNMPYQLIQRIGPFFGQLNMVLILTPKIKDDPTGSTERELLGMAQNDLRELRSAVDAFETWMNQCNERIDEKTKDLH